MKHHIAKAFAVVRPKYVSQGVPKNPLPSRSDTMIRVRLIASGTIKPAALQS